MNATATLRLVALAGAASLAALTHAQPVVISQIGATGGTTQRSWSGPSNHYIEVRNTSGNVVDLTGCALQSAQASGGAWTVRPFPSDFTIPPNGYAVMQIGATITPVNDPNWPLDVSGFTYPADVIGSSGNFSFLGGKFALTSTQVALTSSNPLTSPTDAPFILDFVGYGNADAFEGAAAPALSQTSGQSLYRGCTGTGDTNNNAADFTLGNSAPRNRLSPANLGALTAVGAPNTAAAVSVMQTNAILLTAVPSSCSGAPTGVSMSADLHFVGGPASAPMYDNGTHGDAVANDGTFSLSYTVPDTLLPAPAPGPTINRPYIVPMTATDSLGRRGYTHAAFYVTVAPRGACCIAGQLSIKTEASCNAAGGAYQGNGSSPFPASGTVYPGGQVSLPNNGSNTSSIEISDTTTINSLVVRLDAYHQYLGDLTLTLTHNGTTTVPLLARVGVAGNNATGRPGDLVHTNPYVFSDLGSSFWVHAYNGGKDAFYQIPGGVFAPSGGNNTPASFAPFVGQSVQGTWTLTAIDSDIQNSGFIYDWSLEINPGTSCGITCPGNECGPQDYNGDGDSGTDQDIEAFFACLGGNCCATCFCQGSDFNGDGDFGTDQDIEAFFRVLGGSSC